MSALGNGQGATRRDAHHRVEIEWNQREPVCVAVQTALSDIEESDPTELPPLANYVDPDSLEAFFTGTSAERSTRSLTFEYEDRTVHVDGAGYVLVD